MEIFSKIGGIYETATASFVDGAASSIISTITPVVTTGVIIYFMITGYMVIAGRISEPIGDVLIKCFKIGLVATLCLSIGGITNYVVGGMNGIENMLISAVGGGDNKSVYQMLDANVETALKTISSIDKELAKLDFWQIGKAFSLLLTQIIILLGAAVITIIGAALLMLAKVSLTIILALSPLFIAGLMFPITAKFFDSWFSQALNFILVGVIVIFVCSFAMNSFDIVINDIKLAIGSGATFPIQSLFILLALTFVNTFVLKQAPALAQGLAGGMASAGASLTGMLVAAKNGANMATLGGTNALGRTAIKTRNAALKGAGKLAAKGGRYAANKTGLTTTYNNTRDAVSSRVNRIRNITSRK